MTAGNDAGGAVAGGEFARREHDLYPALRARVGTQVAGVVAVQRLFRYARPDLDRACDAELDRRYELHALLAEPCPYRPLQEVPRGAEQMSLPQDGDRMHRAA